MVISMGHIALSPRARLIDNDSQIEGSAILIDKEINILLSFKGVSSSNEIALIRRPRVTCGVRTVRSREDGRRRRS